VLLLELARVVVVEPDLVWVLPEPAAACNTCGSSGGCAMAVLVRFRRPRPLSVAVPAGWSVTVNDRVLIGIDDGRLLRVVRQTLLVPLGAMLIAGSGAELWLDWAEIPTVSAATLGLLGGFAWVKWRGRGPHGQVPQPRILRCLPRVMDDN